MPQLSDRQLPGPSTPRGCLYDGPAVTEARTAPPDELLVSLALEGDQAAVTSLVTRYQRRVSGFLAQLVGDIEVARDLTQETFLRVWGALDRFDPAYRFSTWLFRIAHNLGVDHLRRRRLATTSLEGEDREGQPVQVAVADLGKDPLGHFENVALAGALRTAIEGLRPEYRELILLRHFAGLSYQEIADLESMPLGTVKNKLFRAHTVLRGALADFL